MLPGASYLLLFGHAPVHAHAADVTLAASILQHLHERQPSQQSDFASCLVILQLAGCLLRSKDRLADTVCICPLQEAKRRLLGKNVKGPQARYQSHWLEPPDTSP